MAGWSEGERERGRATLRAMAGGPDLRSRASWALAVDAYARDDTAGARRLGEAVGSSGGHPALAAMLAGLARAAAGDWPGALRATEPALAYDSAGHAPDPFLRATLHLRRGEWLRRAAQPAEAARAWLWHENLDLRGWPSSEAQPAEVDWALATHARALRARLALAGGDRREGCALARRAGELWANAEPAVARTAQALATETKTCPP